MPRRSAFVSLSDSRKAGVVFCLLSVASALQNFSPPLAAQSDSNGASERVQTLYAEAKAAQSHKDLSTAAAKYEEILKIDPQLAAAYNNLGALYFQEGEYNKAATVLERGLKVNPAMPSALALLGISYFQMGEYSQARPRLEAALRAHPEDSNAELFLVNDLTKLGDFEAAATHLQQLARREPKNQQVWYLLGKVYMQLSEQALGKVNEIDPNSVWAHEISAELMESMKNYDGALIELKKAVELAPKQPGLHYKLGDMYWMLSQWDAASEQFQMELQNDPSNCMAQWKIGNVLLQQSTRPEEALADVNKALRACPNLAEARLDRGRLLLKLHKNEEAIPDLEAATKATPNDATVHFSLAQAYRAVGRTQEAQSEMQTFSKLEESARAATAERAQQAIKNKESVH